MPDPVKTNRLRHKRLILAREPSLSKASSSKESSRANVGAGLATAAQSQVCTCRA